jgi:predicted AAA+ superfamily ATPase
VEIFEHACLVGRLSPWHPGSRSVAAKPSRALKSRSKLYAEDHGFIPAFSPLPTPMANGEIRARLFETVVFTHLRDLRDRRKDFSLGFCREDEELEIDFVLDFGDQAVGVEVTSSKNPEKKAAKTAKLARRIRLGHATVVHDGIHAVKEDEHVSSWPIEAFLLDPNDCIERSLRWARKSR